MATNENLIPIPGRLHSVASEGHVAGADEIYDDNLGITLDQLSTKHASTGTTGDYPYNGMGRIFLKKNMVNAVCTLTQAMMQAVNTIYVIQYDFTLGEDITVPANCVLEFDGGSISGSNIVFQNTYLDGDWFKGQNCYATGIVRNNVVYPEMFAPNNANDWAGIVNEILSNHNNICFAANKEYHFLSSINITGSNKTIIGEENSLLVYYGDSDFLKVGIDSVVRYIKLYNVQLKAANTCNRLLSIYYTANSTFEYVSCYGNNKAKEGFGRPTNCGHLITSVFMNCKAWDCEDGWNFKYDNNGQVNDITFIDCGSGRTSKNGMVINGYAIRIIGGDFANSDLDGILIDGTTDGLCIIGSYFEVNTGYALHITNKDIRNVDVKSIYIMRNNVKCDINKFERITKNIHIGHEERFTKYYNFGFANISSIGSTPEEAFYEISGVKLPCEINVEFSNITTPSFLYTILGYYLNGIAYQLKTNCEVKEVTAVNGTTITLDSALSDTFSLYNHIDIDNPLRKLIGKQSIKDLGLCILTTDNWKYITDQDYTAPYGQTKNKIINTIDIANATQGATTVTIDNPNIQVGDLLVFTSNARGDRLNGNSISIAAANTKYTQQQSLPSIASSLPACIKEGLCVLFYVSPDIYNYTIKYASAQYLGE